MAGKGRASPRYAAEVAARAPGRPLSGRRAARARRAALLAVAGAGLLSLLLLALRGSLSTANVALLYLLPVLVGATLGGLAPGILAALVSAFALDLLFIPPYGTLSVSSGQDFLTLMLYLAVGALVAELAERARRRAEEAGRREAASALLYDLSTALLAGDVPEILQALVERIGRAFELQSCAILLPDEHGKLALRSVAGNPPAEGSGDPMRQVDAVAAWAFANGEMVSLALERSARFQDRVRRPAGTGVSAIGGDALVILPLRSGSGGALHSVGVLRMVRPQERPLSDEEIRLLGAFGTQAALAVERAQLASASAEAAVLRESDRAKSVLLSNVSHELRSPLTTIRGAAESLLQDEVELDAATREDLLRSVRDEAERLGTLVSNLLDLSRLEAGSVRLDRHLYDLGEIAGGVAARLAPRLARHRLRMQLDPHGGLVQVDYAMMEQVVANLLDNAAKYAPDGSTVILSIAASGDAVELAVEDEGPGIPPAARQRVFERFYRHPQVTRRDAPGSGLGLAICRAVVEAHGGRIWIEDGAHSGARVRVRLPRAVAETDLPEATGVPA